MNQNRRILIAVVALLVVVGVILGADSFQRRQAASVAPAAMPPGSIPIFMEGKFVASFVPEDLNQLESASFVDSEEGKTQDGWMLRDVLMLYIKENKLKADTQITVSSSSREKSETLAWAEVENQANHVMFDLSGRGTLKLVSTIPGFDIRASWIQDVDKIDLTTP
jgi:hypothetical protein